MATQRPVVTVYSSENKNAVASAPLPDVFNAPIRADIVNIFHNFALKNLRQPYAVHRYAGKQHSAESWGTGRAVSRIPRISGGGTHRSGQGAFGNMCRGGRMFAPTKVFRRWASKVNHNEKRYAVVSAIAASGVAPLVMARGHKVEQLAEVPFVVSNDVESYSKTKQAAQFLKRINAFDDVQKVKDTKSIRAGQGKNRGRRYRQRRGPLVVYKNDNGIVRAFRNIPGVDLLSVDRLNVLKLAPGGRVGRFIIWTQGAFEALNARFGSYNNRYGASTYKRQNATYHLPRPSVSNTDITGIIASDAIQNVVRPAQIRQKAGALKARRHNPLRKFGFYRTLNPYAVREAKKAFWTKLESSSKTEKASKTAKFRQERQQKVMANFYDKYIKPLSQ